MWTRSRVDIVFLVRLRVGCGTSFTKLASRTHGAFADDELLRGRDQETTLSGRGSCLGGW